MGFLPYVCLSCCLAAIRCSCLSDLLPRQHISPIRQPNVLRFSSGKWQTIELKRNKGPVFLECRSHWPRGLTRRSAAARLLRLWVRIPPVKWMSVCCKCCVLSGRGLCDRLITRPEKSYRLWCVDVWNLETSWMRRPWLTGGCCAKRKEKKEKNFLNKYLLTTERCGFELFSKIFFFRCNVNFVETFN